MLTLYDFLKCTDTRRKRRENREKQPRGKKWAASYTASYNAALVVLGS